MPPRRQNNKHLADPPNDTVDTPPRKKQKNDTIDPAAEMKNCIDHEVIDLNTDYVLRNLKSKRGTPDCFPTLHKGTVYIELKEHENKYCYILEKELLAKVCKSLSYLLCGPPHKEPNSTLAETMKKREALEFFFKLQYIPQYGLWGLYKSSFTKLNLSCQDQPQVSILTNTPIQARTPNMQTLPTVESVQSPRHAKAMVLANQLDSTSHSPTENLKSPAPNKSSKDPATLTNAVPLEMTSSSTTQTPVKAFREQIDRNAEVGKRETKSEEHAESQQRIKNDAGGNINTLTESATIREMDVEMRPKEETDDNVTAATHLACTESQQIEKEAKDEVECSAPAATEAVNVHNQEIATDVKEDVKEGVKDETNDSTTKTTEPTITQNQDIEMKVKEEINGSIITTNEPILTQNMEIEMEVKDCNLAKLKPSNTSNIRANESIFVNAALQGCNSANGQTLTAIQLDAIPVIAEPGNATPKNSSTVVPKFTLTRISKIAHYAHSEAAKPFSVRKDVEIAPASHNMGSQDHRLAVEAHDNIFRFLYCMAPELERNDINHALNQIEYIYRIADLYQCRGLIDGRRHYLNEHLLQFGRSLYKAVLQDPPRWIRLSVQLQCAPIFKEGVIHLVGQYPHYPWTTIPSSDLYPQVLHLIRKKVDELKALKASIDAELFKSTIFVEGEPLLFHNIDRSTFDTWMIVQLWRDWFCSSLCKQECGSIYRLMARGNSAYLDSVSVYSNVVTRESRNCTSWTLKGIEDDLKMMKDFAQKAVKKLVVNHSMLDIEDTGIQHLTCIHIENDELPWAKKDAA